jgi:hypothetical protein
MKWSNFGCIFDVCREGSSHYTTMHLGKTDWFLRNKVFPPPLPPSGSPLGSGSTLSELQQLSSSALAVTARAREGRCRLCTASRSSYSPALLLGRDGA